MDMEQAGGCSISQALLARLRPSLLGPFLRQLNEPQHRTIADDDNELGMLQQDLKRGPRPPLELLRKRNCLTDDVLGLLEEAVRSANAIDVAWVQKTFQVLRMSNSNIIFIDKGLAKFTNLQCLVLCGNHIHEVLGANLPRRLRFLEMYQNSISNLESFCRRAPKKLLHLGLGDNQLSDASHLNTLSNCGNFKYLKTLDLSNNDICCLQGAMEALSELQQLNAISLEGNPCWASMCYKEAILKNFPRLLYLDEVQVVREDATDISDSKLINCESGAFLVTACRVANLSKPPQEKYEGKAVRNAFELEVIIPQLDFDGNEPESGDLPAPVQENVQKASKKSAEGGKKAGPSVYDKDVGRGTFGKVFRSERMQWGKEIKFPSPALEIQPPNADLLLYRNIFRSSITARLVHLKIFVPDEKKKKPKKAETGKLGKKKVGVKAPKKLSKKKKDKAKGKAKDKTKNKAKDKDVVKEEEPPKAAGEGRGDAEENMVKEVVLKKTVLADFDCQLVTYKWNKDSISYVWNGGLIGRYVESPEKAKLSKKTEKKNKKQAVEKISKSKSKKGEKKSKKGENKSKKGKKGSPTSSAEKAPKTFTCYLNFALKRIGSVK